VHGTDSLPEQICFVTADARPDMTECNAYSTAFCVRRRWQVESQIQVLLEIPAIDRRWRQGRAAQSEKSAVNCLAA